MSRPAGIGEPLTAPPATGYRILLPAGHEGHPLDLYAVERPRPADRPWVLANFVAGLDGAVAVDGRVGPLTSPADQEVFHHLRSLADVVLVGAGTVRAEGYGPVRPTTEQREARVARGQAAVPPIAVVSRSLRFELDAGFFTATEVRPLVVCPAAAAASAPPELVDRAELLVAGEEVVDLRVALSELRARGARIVLCEGGPALVAELLADHLLDELCLTLAPLTGGDPLRLVGGEAATPLVGFELAHVLVHGNEVYLRYLTGGERQDG